MVSTLSLTTKSSEFEVSYFPSLDLDDKKWELGLLNFQAYNTIPNIDTRNNKFHFDDGKGVIEIPTGSYEIKQISEYLSEKINEYYQKNNKNSSEGDDELKVLILEGNTKTLKTEIWCIYSMDFTQDHSIGAFLGFFKEILSAKETHISESTLNISKVNVIRIITNITTGAYVNNKPTPSIFEFALAIDPGFKISITPQNIIYFPIIVKNITNLHIKVVDQDFDLVDFRGESISILLHLREIKI